MHTHATAAVAAPAFPPVVLQVPNARAQAHFERGEAAEDALPPHPHRVLWGVDGQGKGQGEEGGGMPMDDSWVRMGAGGLGVGAEGGSSLPGCRR